MSEAGGRAASAGDRQHLNTLSAAARASEDYGSNKVSCFCTAMWVISAGGTRKLVLPPDRFASGIDGNTEPLRSIGIQHRHISDHAPWRIFPIHTRLMETPATDQTDSPVQGGTLSMRSFALEPKLSQQPSLLPRPTPPPFVVRGVLARPCDICDSSTIMVAAVFFISRRHGTLFSSPPPS